MSPTNDETRMCSRVQFSLPSVPGGWREETLLVAGHSIVFSTPEDPDLILDDPAVLEENARTDYMPYWCWLWPAARRMAEIVHGIPFAAGEPVLEVGTGLGLVGIAGLYAGFDVVLSDYREESLQAAQANAITNGFEDVDIDRIDWNEPVSRQYRSVMACDVLYEEKDHASLLSFADKLLTHDGSFWIGDPGRQRAAEFVERASETFSVEYFNDSLEQIPGPLLARFFLIRLTQKP